MDTRMTMTIAERTKAGNINYQSKHQGPTIEIPQESLSDDIDNIMKSAKMTKDMHVTSKVTVAVDSDVHSITANMEQTAGKIVVTPDSNSRKRKQSGSDTPLQTMKHYRSHSMEIFSSDTSSSSEPEPVNVSPHSDEEKESSPTSIKVVSNSMIQGNVNTTQFFGGMHYHHLSPSKPTIDIGFIPVNCEHFQPRVKLHELKAIIINSKQKIVKLAVTGISGSGKTELAKRFALDYQDGLLQQTENKETNLPGVEFDVSLSTNTINKKLAETADRFVGWLDARTEEHLFGSWQELADRFQITKKERDENAVTYKQRILKQVKQHIVQYTEWVLIFDDAVSAGSIVDFLPESARGRGNIVVTTQHTGFWGNSKQEISLNDGLSIEEACELIRRIYLTYFPERTKTDFTHFEGLAGILGRLPLAVAITAHHFAQENQRNQENAQHEWTVQEFINRYISTPDKEKKTEKDTIHREIADKDKYKRTQEQVVSAAIQRTKGSYKQLLLYCAVLDTKSLSLELLLAIAREAKLALPDTTPITDSHRLLYLLNVKYNHSFFVTMEKGMCAVHDVTREQLLLERPEDENYYQTIFNSLTNLMGQYTVNQRYDKIQSVVSHLFSLVNMIPIGAHELVGLKSNIFDVITQLHRQSFISSNYFQIFYDALLEHSTSNLEGHNKWKPDISLHISMMRNFYMSSHSWDDLLRVNSDVFYTHTFVERVDTEQTLLKVLDFFKGEKNINQQLIDVTMVHWALMLNKIKRYSESLEHLNVLIERIIKIYGEDNQLVACIYLGMGSAYRKQSNEQGDKTMLSKAEETLKKALKIFSVHPKTADHPIVGIIHLELSILYDKQGLAKKSSESHNKASSFLRDNFFKALVLHCPAMQEVVDSHKRCIGFYEEYEREGRQVFDNIKDRYRRSEPQRVSPKTETHSPNATTSALASNSLLNTQAQPVKVSQFEGAQSSFGCSI